MKFKFAIRIHIYFIRLYITSEATFVVYILFHRHDDIYCLLIYELKYYYKHILDILEEVCVNEKAKY
jgi:hypothetical protein